MDKKCPLSSVSKIPADSGIEKAEKPSRIFLLDELRGFLILFVICYHIFYDLYLFGYIAQISPFLNHLRDFLISILIMISGVSCHLSRSNLKRGLKTLAAALVISAATYLFIPGQLITFGILHFFACAMCLYPLLKKPLSKIFAPLGFGICVLLFLLTFNLSKGVFGVAGLELTFSLPDFLSSSPLMFALGFPCSGFQSADYYPLFPWLFIFLAGSFCGPAIKEGRFPAFFYRSHTPLLAAIGRHTLFIYLLHQPILYGLFLLLSELI